MAQSVPAFVYSPAKQTAGTSSDAQLRAKVCEESCVGSLRTLNTAQTTYWGGDAKKGFARSLKQLGPRGEDLIEQVLATGKKDGYQFVLTQAGGRERSNKTLHKSARALESFGQGPAKVFHQ
jgi:hypothetical protein